MLESITHSLDTFTLFHSLNHLLCTKASLFLSLPLSLSPRTNRKLINFPLNLTLSFPVHLQISFFLYHSPSHFKLFEVIYFPLARNTFQAKIRKEKHPHFTLPLSLSSSLHPRVEFHPFHFSDTIWFLLPGTCYLLVKCKPPFATTETIFSLSSLLGLLVLSTCAHSIK